MTALEDNLKAIADTRQGIITLLLSSTEITNIISDTLLEEDGNVVSDNSYPYGEVISTTKNKGKFESRGYRDLDLNFAIQYYTRDLGVEGKEQLILLAAATETIIEQNIHYSPWRNIDWKGTHVDGFFTDKDSGEPTERFAVISYDFSVQVKRD